MAELAADPGWVPARAEADAKIARLAEQRRRALQPVTLELRAVGFDVKSPWELHKHSPYPEAIPILFRHLRLPSYAEEPRAAIAQALAVPETRDHWREIVDMYRQTDPRQDRLMQALANVIDVTANRRVSDKLVELVFILCLGRRGCCSCAL